MLFFGVRCYLLVRFLFYLVLFLVLVLQSLSLILLVGPCFEFVLSSRWCSLVGFLFFIIVRVLCSWVLFLELALSGP